MQYSKGYDNSGKHDEEVMSEVRIVIRKRERERERERERKKKRKRKYIWPFELTFEVCVAGGRLQ